MESFTARSTAYYPDSSPLEGGFEDRHGKPLFTLQDFLTGRAEYVSVAMDAKAFKYGTVLCIPAIDKYYRGRKLLQEDKTIIFRVVDTGGAFRGKGRERIDVCVADEIASFHYLVNYELDIVALI